MGVENDWLYFGTYGIQKSKNSIVFPKSVFNEGVFDRDDRLYWGVQRTCDVVVHIVANKHLENSPIEVDGSLYESTSLGGEDNKRRGTIPKKFFSDYAQGEPFPSEMQMEYGERQYFLTPSRFVNQGVLFLLNSSQVEAVVNPRDWNESENNWERLRADKELIPNSILPGELGTEGGGEVAEKNPNEERDTRHESIQNSHQSNPDKGIRFEADLLPGKSTVDRELIDYIDANNPDTLFLLEYSSNNAREIIDSALQNDCTVYLLVRHPSRSIRWRVSNSQSERIKDATKDLIDEYIDKIHERNKQCSLYIQYYYHPAGLRARRIDNSLLCTGWYTFENRDSVGKDPEKLHVHGDDNPMMLVSNQSESYPVLNEMFEKSFYALWKQGTSLLTLYQGNYWESLQDWVNHRKQREKMIELVSSREAIHLFSHKEWMDDIHEVDEEFFYPDWRRH